MVGPPPPRQLRQRHRRINVVERPNAPRFLLHPVADGDALGDIRADNDRLGASHIVRKPRFQVLQAGVYLGPAIGRPGQVAVLGIPGRVPLQKQDAVAAPGQPAH